MLPARPCHHLQQALLPVRSMDESLMTGTLRILHDLGFCIASKALTALLVTRLCVVHITSW